MSGYKTKLMSGGHPPDIRRWKFVHKKVKWKKIKIVKLHYESQQQWRIVTRQALAIRTRILDIGFACEYCIQRISVRLSGSRKTIVNIRFESVKVKLEVFCHKNHFFMNSKVFWCIIWAIWDKNSNSNSLGLFQFPKSNSQIQRLQTVWVDCSFENRAEWIFLTFLYSFFLQQFDFL